MANFAKHHKALITAAIASILEYHGIEVLTATRDVLDLSVIESIADYIVSQQEAGIDIIVNNTGVNILVELACSL